MRQVRVKFRVPSETHAAMVRAAIRQGVTGSDFLRCALDHELRRVARRERREGRAA